MLEIEKLQNALNDMHKDVRRTTSIARQRQIEHHNSKTNIVFHRFREGDFILIRRAVDTGHKQEFRWQGPRVITRVLKDTVYEG